MSCNHDSWEAMVTVVNLADKEVKYAEMSLRCAHCGIVGRFLGLPVGGGGTAPAVNFYRHQVSLPFMPDLPPALGVEGEQLNQDDLNRIAAVLDLPAPPMPGFVLLPPTDEEQS